MTVDRIGNMPVELLNNKLEQNKLKDNDNVVIIDRKNLRNRAEDYEQKTDKVKRKKLNKTNKNKGKRKRPIEMFDTNDRNEGKLIINSERKVKSKKNKQKSGVKSGNKVVQTQGLATLTRNKVK